MPIETPDKANAFLTGETAFALSDKDPDYPALLLANYMLGGSTTSRLWNRVRQKEGLSYGINSSMHAQQLRAEHDASSISAIFAPENLERLRRAVQDELERASARGLRRRKKSPTPSAPCCSSDGWRAPRMRRWPRR